MRKVRIIGAFIFLLLINSCGEKFEIIEELGGTEYRLADQENRKVIFPGMMKGNAALVNYIFTNCPDICPLSTNNMRLIQEKLKQEKIFNVRFVSISFDPEHDTPEVLRKFAEVRDLDLSNWSFLTGRKSTIDSLMTRVGILAVVGDSTVFKDGRKIYYYVHTDRISLVDADGNIRKNYIGSNAPVEEIVTDIKSLAD